MCKEVITVIDTGGYISIFNIIVVDLIITFKFAILSFAQ